jgi:centrosomal protein CEP120
MSAEILTEFLSFSIRPRVQQISINNHATTDDRLPSPVFHTSSDHHLSHHYCLSIDLKSLRNLRLSNSTYLFCRYVYPFLGTSTPIITHPPLHVPYTSSAPPNEHLLPHGLCVFNFAVNSEQLASHFHREPLTIEVYSRDQERSERKDQLFGIISLQLDQVLHAEKQRCSSSANGILGWRQTWTQVLPVIGENTE